MRKLVECFGFAVVILLMTAAMLTFLAPRFGWRVDALFSGSMEPQLKVGSLVITRPAQPEHIIVGDTITFCSPASEKLTSHRVIAVENGASFYFRTKGDASEDADPFIVPPENMVGKVYFHIPYFGYVTQSVKTTLGFMLTLYLPGLIIIIIEIRNIWRVLAEEETERKYRIG